jgi:hypothetical protein
MQHVKTTNIFENSLRLINPQLALPYWDFTVDNKEGKKAHDSFVMQVGE